MSSVAIASIVFACVFGGALFGMLLRSVLPEHHLNPDSKDVVKLAMGLIATMAALVLGLLTGSAKGTFDTLDNNIKETAVNILVLDRTLAHYGPETQEVREGIRRTLAARLEATWPEDESHSPKADAPDTKPGGAEGIGDRVRALSPQTDAQRSLQSRAVSLTDDLLRTRWLLFGGVGNSFQMPLLVVLVFWLAALFVSFGLFAPRNGTVVVVLVVAALSVSGSIFLILELNDPLEGLLKVSSAPLRYALAHLGQ